jgi:hypothetical protein
MLLQGHLDNASFNICVCKLAITLAPVLRLLLTLAVLDGGLDSGWESKAQVRWQASSEEESRYGRKSERKSVEERFEREGKVQQGQDELVRGRPLPSLAMATPSPVISSVRTPSPLRSHHAPPPSTSAAP